MKASIIVTERNEVDAIVEFIDSALAQSVKPDEIVIADGGSTDGTIEIIKEYIAKGAPINLVHAPGNRSVGRNAATRAAKNEIIAVTDVGSRSDKDWFKNIIEPFKNNPKAMAVSGFFLPDPQTYFERVSATLMLNANEKIDIDTWLPSSRSVAYKKAAWEKAGGYPEYTNFNEDTPFDLALKAAGFKFEDGLKAIVYWRPRPNFKEFYRQYYFYAVGDGIDALNWETLVRLYIKYVIVGISLVGVALSIWPLLIILGYFLYKTHLRVIGPWKKLGGARTYLLMVLLIISYDISQMQGYAYGYLRRNKLRGSKRLVR